jgi:type I restriction enzyme S subunit
LKYRTTKIGSGVTPRGGADSYVSSGVAFLRSQNVYDDGLRLDDVAYISEDVDKTMSRTRLQVNDVLLNITGASIGRSSIVPEDVLPANVNQHVCIVRPSATISAQFLAYALKSQAVREQIFGGENGSSREGLNYQQVGNLWIAIPDTLEEQERIVSFLDNATRAIDLLKAKVTKAIALLNEHRSALIVSAVTGATAEALCEGSLREATT